MRHVVVLAPGDDVELHWQRTDSQPTIHQVMALMPPEGYFGRCRRYDDMHTPEEGCWEMRWRPFSQSPGAVSVEVSAVGKDKA